ncbi:MAG: T9SS type A sorting domain-containing protein [Dinghuibacter sp.]|nr:T9SS type A sorting domain-containing protein [Dinghuibacter sp.]
MVLLMVIWASASKAYSGTTIAKQLQPYNNTDTTNYSGQPLRLRSFTARVLSGNRIELNWVTAETWITVTHFEVQRSYNGSVYETVGIVTQTDNRPIDQNYRFTDAASVSASRKVVYYRLKQVNRDGRINFSFVVPVKMDEEQNAAVSVWPVPAKDEVTVSFHIARAGEVVLHVFDYTGKKVRTSRYLGETGKNMVQLTDLNGLNAGVYIVQVWLGNDVAATASFLKGQ